MSEKRRDNKGRILNTGESQRNDGRYAYKYTGANGKPQFLYSWKLTATDKMPAGKREDISLRDKEKELQKDINDGINTLGSKMTVCQLYEKQNKQRSNVKYKTIEIRKYFMELLKNDPIGTKTIDCVKLSDAKEWAIRMSEKGICFSSINNYKRSLKASFYIAVQDDYIRKNPFDFKLNTIIEDNTKPKNALTEEQVNYLLSFTKSDTVLNKYYDEIVILLESGLRISELCGITISDLDFDNRYINIDHQLLRNK